MYKSIKIQPIYIRCILLLVLGLLIYGQTFHYGFVFDDCIFIVNDPYIKDFAMSI